MRKLKWLMFAGLLVGCVYGGWTWRSAVATPGKEITSTSIVGPVLMGEINTKAETDDWEFKLKTKGLSDVYVTHVKVAPGGYSGWHSHPGPSIVSVKSGTATIYNDCDGAVKPHRYPKGTGFVDDAGCVHILVNEGDVDLEVIVMHIVPFGAPRTNDEADPRD